ncbi:MAG: DUF192 domain-containing protein [Verrucomicrobiota bacterium]
MKGLLGRSDLLQQEGIWLKPCSQIHMFFMKFPIDAIFMNKGMQVVYIADSIAPWKISKWVGKAHSVLECCAGKAREAGLKVGDTLEFKSQS